MSVLSSKTYKCIHCNKECKWTNQKSNKYCSVQCQRDFEYEKYIADWKAGIVDGCKGKLQTSGYIHKYVFKKQEGKCAECSIIDYNNKSITLELDHIDGNGKNNREMNLRCLCPNCHSQTSTYRSKNKGNGRKGRKS